MERAQILERIKEYEQLELFDRDVEEDPPTRPLKPGEVDYLQQKWTTRVCSAFANQIAKHYFDGCIKRGELVIKEVRGLENYMAVDKQGVIITANHFHPYDNYAVFKVIEKALGRRRLYKIIREGNYTSFPGLYGFFFRHCNTLPLGSNTAVWRELTHAVRVLLQERQEKILIYPEQGMWWNYRKPRPLKAGAFRFAADAGAPVLPFFLTMEDTDRLDGEGYPIQAYTVHIAPAVYPDPACSVRENARRMSEENYQIWKRIYEDTYGIPLQYTTEDVKHRDLYQHHSAE